MILKDTSLSVFTGISHKIALDLNVYGVNMWKSKTNKNLHKEHAQLAWSGSSVLVKGFECF